MRILVGTLYTIENEFTACVESINQQTHRAFEHFIIRDLPNKQAHDTLYRSFMTRADEFDLFMKIDADMVLIDDRFFEKIIQRFQTQPNRPSTGGMNALIVSVQDWFSDRLIEGLHTYRSRVRWEVNDEQVFVDRASLAPDQIVYDKTDLAPAAQHCPDPSAFEAFHYGIHKGVKVHAAMQRYRRATARFHMSNIESTWRHFERSGDQRLGLACLGAELALKGAFQPHHVDYQNPTALSVLRDYESLDSGSLRLLISKLRRRNWSWLPPMSRAEALVDGPLRFAAKRMIPRRLHGVAASLMGKRQGVVSHTTTPTPVTAPASENHPPVTWLLPVKNAMPHLTDTLKSISEQSYPNHGVIAWDNGSTDGSVRELRRWIPQVIPGRVIADHPMGLGASLAAMVEMSTTELCARIDGDDVNTPDRLAQQVEFMTRHPDLGIVGADIQFIDVNGGDIPGAWRVATDDADIRWRLRFTNALNHPAVMLKRSVVLAAGNYRDLKPGQDYDLWLRLAAKTRMANLSKRLVLHRLHDRSVSAGRRDDPDAVNRRIASDNAHLLFPGFSPDEAIRLRHLGMFAIHPTVNVSDCIRFRRAATLSAYAIGAPPHYFRQTELYRSQYRRLLMLLLKTNTSSRRQHPIHETTNPPLRRAG